MRKGILSSLIFISACTLLTLQSCNKSDSLGIDNDRVVRTPYGFYAAASDGSLIHSNDGLSFSNIFPPDGFPTDLLLVAGENLMMLKENLHLSQTNGRNFNPVHNSVRKFPWQSMAYVTESHAKRIYLTTRTGKGVSYSEDDGLTWIEEEAFVENLPAYFEISSFAELRNGVLFAFSNESNILFRKENIEENWHPVTIEGLFPVEGTEFYLISNQSTLFLIDYKGKGGVWFSEDEGRYWTRIEQGALPLNVTWNAAISPAEGRSLLVGTEDNGVFRVENDGFIPASGGLQIGTSVNSFSNKKNIYKNNATRSYVYMGTSDGIYISENRGTTWDKITFEELEKEYLATY